MTGRRFSKAAGLDGNQQETQRPGLRVLNFAAGSESSASSFSRNEDILGLSDPEKSWGVNYCTP